MRLILWALLAGCAPATLTPLAPDDADQGYAAALGSLDRRIEATAALANGTDWTHHERLVWLHLSRARLAGGYDDYDAALGQLDLAFAIAPESSGPHQAEAAVLASLHRLDEAELARERAATRLLLSDPERASLLRLQADLDWQAGRYDAAGEHLRDALALDESFEGIALEAHQHVGVAAYDDADLGFVDAGALLLPGAHHPRAWVELQRGIVDLDRGHLDDALEHFADADAALPGWWLVHEHIAEVWTLQGHTDAAVDLYERVIAETDSPEFMDALAAIRADRGEDPTELIEAARRRYEGQLARHPEAAAGHALDHFLEWGPPARAVALADANLAARPNAEARMKCAQAYLLAGDPRGARVHIEAALDTPWRSPELHDTAEAVYRALGDDGLAAAQGRAAARLRE